MASDADSPLRGKAILVTRPRQQAQRLCDMIRAAGGRAIRIPAMTILPPQDDGPARLALQARAAYDAVIFVSRNAVLFAEKLSPEFVSAHSGKPVYAVGAGTAAELEMRGIDAMTPRGDQYGSEALLELASLKEERVRGRSVLIVRGIEGRMILCRELTRRGARVTSAEVYRRAAPEPDPAGLRRMWRDEPPDVIVITSVQGLEQLVSMTDPEWRAALLGTALVTISGRVARRASGLGFRAPVRVARAASDEGLMDTITQTLSEQA
ncbi:MAG: uroporphyrinogen-III synthase [Gammaproteobacteria bacterium]|nr:uroporphyrinogen-III synthase [Gammaproteobacteria bacterium]